MTAICACWSRDGHIDAAEALRRMRAPLAMYGGDRWGEWRGAGVALGIHQRYVLPEDRMDRQPDCRDGIVVAATLRLDNRGALARELEIDSAIAREMPDSEILRAAWRRWGAECVHHLLGDYAFIVWDDVWQTLFCVRDPFGTHPLCYARVGGMVAVASMPKGLIALPNVSRALNEVRLGEHLAMMPRHDGSTFFKDVSLVPPGYLLQITPDRMELRRYWHPPSGVTVRFARDEEYVERFLELYEDAVAVRLRSLDPVAATLSAGLDSGSVTALAARHLAKGGKRLPALTWVPRADAHIPSVPTRLTDERVPAAAVAALYPNVDHLLIEAPDRNPFAELAAFDDAADEPFVTPLTLPMYRAMGDRLRELGCGVLLTGQWGNMTVSYNGLRLPQALLRRGRLVRGARETLALARTPGYGYRGALHTALTPLIPQAAQRMLTRVRRRGESGAHPLAYCTVNTAFAAQHRIVERAAELGWIQSTNAPTDGLQLRATILGGIDLGMTHLGLHATLGVQLRDPTVDRRVVEYCFSIPEEQFLRNGTSRWLIRRAMSGLLPSIVLDAPHRGLQGSDWPRFMDPYREAYAAEVEAIAESPMAARILDVAELRRIMEPRPEQWAGRDMARYPLKLLRGVGVGTFLRRAGGC